MRPRYSVAALLITSLIVAASEPGQAAVSKTTAAASNRDSTVAVSASRTLPTSAASPAGGVGFAASLGANPITVFGLDDYGNPARVSCPNWLTFASPRLTYTQAELNEIADALVGYSPFVVSHTPPALRSVAVAPTASAKSWLEDPYCELNLQITNMTRGTIQIPRVGWRLLGQTQLTDHIRLLDRCSSLARDVCSAPGGGRGPGSCSWYVAEITLTPMRAGSDFVARPLGYKEDLSPCPPITLRSGQSIEVATEVRSEEPGAYRMVPAIVVLDASASITIVAPNLAGNMAFADADQFRCFARKDHVYVEVASGAAALTSAAPRWCV